MKHKFILFAIGQKIVPDFLSFNTRICNKNPINHKKIEDIKKLLQYIPHEYTSLWFYSALMEWPSTSKV